MREEVHRIPVDGQKVALVLHLPERTPAPCVVACHGLGASKDSEKYLLLGREFPGAGLVLARFDFRGCGESDGVYSESTIGTRVRDAEGVLEFLVGHPELNGRFGLLGSSMGGYVALFVAAAGRLSGPVVTWNCPATLRGLDPTRSQDLLGLGAAFFDELRAGRYVDAPSGVRCSLTIQADHDEVVPPHHGQLLFDRAAEPRELVLLCGADHRLSDTRHRLEALTRSLAWFGRFLCDSK
ncbi:MAG: alpha/beta fold hydrolase [Candidatus Rokubacteria bacterium]|nr:alpha/beta fold hydrolase [Candidatus Rokubacteria bacterium]